MKDSYWNRSFYMESINDDFLCKINILDEIYI